MWTSQITLVTPKGQLIVGISLATWNSWWISAGVSSHAQDGIASIIFTVPFFMFFITVINNEEIAK